MVVPVKYSMVVCAFLVLLCSHCVSASPVRDPHTLHMYSRSLRKPFTKFTRGISNYYKLFPRAIPSGPPPAGKFEIDLKQLRNEYIQAQRGAHPDVAGNSSQVSSAELSNAYRALSNPLSRAEHILELNSVNPLQEDASLQDEDLLMEIMMAREHVSEAESEEELQPIAKDNDERYAQAEKKIAQALNAGDFDSAKKVLVQLTYWTKLREAIEAKIEELKTSN